MKCACIQDTSELILQDPGLNPGSDPGSNPGSDPGSDPGSNPGSDPGSNPGSNPGSDPGSDPGSNPGSDPDSKFRYPPVFVLVKFVIGSVFVEWSWVCILLTSFLLQQYQFVDCERGKQIHICLTMCSTNPKCKQQRECIAHSATIWKRKGTSGP